MTDSHSFIIYLFLLQLDYSLMVTFNENKKDNKRSTLKSISIQLNTIFAAISFLQVFFFIQQYTEFTLMVVK